MEIDLPGFTRDDIEVTMEKGVLSISAKREQQSLPEDVDLDVEQLPSWHFARRFKIPMPIEESKICAKLSDGVLLVTMPKREEMKPKSIPIE